VQVPGGAHSYPAAVKTACVLVGDTTGPVRAPLPPLGEDATAELQRLLNGAHVALDGARLPEPSTA